MKGFHKLLLWLSSLTGTDYSRFPQSICTKLTKTFQLYECKYGDTLLCGQHVPASGGESKAKEACDDIYGCWGLVLKCYELRTRQHKMSMVKVLRPSKHYLA
jgi:hypothetical protein